MDMQSFNGRQGGDNDGLLPNDSDMLDDLHEESHHRRSYHHDDEHRENERGDNRDRSMDRHHGHQDSDSRRHDDDRDAKYDRRDSASHGYNDGGRAGGARRSRSRSPARRSGGSGATGGSVQDRRVYVGNLSYDVKWTHLKDFMREIGPVAHADVLLGHDGRSKGCGVVEYQNAEDARTAIRKLNDVVLMGRPVFVREDRESGESRIGFSGGRGAGVSGPPSRHSAPSSASARQVFVGNLPYSVNWKDLKDLFRRAGHVDRADVFMTRENRSKGSGTVSFDSSRDVGRAISMFNGYDWHGRRIEVREDKFGPPSGGSSRAGPSSHSYDSGHSRNYRDSGHDLYDGARSSNQGDYRDDINMAAVPSGPAAGSGDQIYVRNLPLTTTSQDLKDLFRICGGIKMAEILDSTGRSKASGIVRFELYESADKAVSKFNGYVYGGRPLEIVYDRA
ncbi:hypothetical protein BGZ51_003367 [Haplosporangium sp. Z 767]|nr:hypothetical protein BGZ51_003367 [Haplosporangium sp. Z 767]KAF9189108.1 hypothetical protein BGZ50_000945 [Haplosporangium sp. Z 11]